MGRLTERRLARLQQASLAQLCKALQENERGGDPVYSTRLFRSIGYLITSMSPTAKPTFTEFCDHLPVRYRGLMYQASWQRAAQEGIDLYPPAQFQPNTSWDEFEDSYEVAPITEAENV